MKFGIHNPSWVYGPDAADAFEAVKAKAQWAEDHGFVWFSVMDHLIQISDVGAPLAAVTSRIRLATLATSVGYRRLSPFLVQANLDETFSPDDVAGARLLLLLGALVTSVLLLPDIGRTVLFALACAAASSG